MNFLEIWERIKEATELKTLTNLAKLIEITQQSVSERKKKNEFPIEWAYKISRKYEISIEWILTGEGNKNKNEGIDEYIAEINRWFEKIKKENPENEDWFKVQFKRSFPEFKEWEEQQVTEVKEKEFLSRKIREKVD